MIVGRERDAAAKKSLKTAKTGDNEQTEFSNGPPVSWVWPFQLIRSMGGQGQSVREI